MRLLLTGGTGLIGSAALTALRAAGHDVVAAVRSQGSADAVAAVGATPLLGDITDVGWFTETTSDGYLFTTIGRDFYVSVEVPHDYEPEADALADLADSVARHDPVKQPCV